MAKELFIMFIYDTHKCQKEEDDPQEAVLYFYPSWVSDQQKLALCGQLIGASQFLISSFSCPKLISLKSGKFMIKQSERFLIVVGTDRNIPNWIIEQRAYIVHNLFEFYHLNLDSLASLHEGPASNQFITRLGQIFDVYIPIIQSNGNIYENISNIKLPKTASNIFLEAMQILQCCQEKNGVLAGLILYQNCVVATQLNSYLTKLIMMTNPNYVKVPAENINLNFHLPFGVQLLKIYVRRKDYDQLLQETYNTKAALDVLSRVSNTTKAEVISHGSSNLSSMKRSTSKIFTVPEEEPESEQINLPPVINESPPLTTPMKENFKPLHLEAVSIIRSEKNKETIESQDKEILPENKTEQPFNEMAAEIEKFNNRSKYANELQSSSMKQSLSLNHLVRMPLRGYCFGLPKFSKEDGETSPRHQFCNTIVDPINPYFHSNGRPLSRSLFNQHLENEYSFQNEIQNRKPKVTHDTTKSLSESYELKSLENISIKDNIIKNDNSEKEDTDENNIENSNLNEKTDISKESDNFRSLIENKSSSIPIEKESLKIQKQKLNRQTLSLPLKTQTPIESHQDYKSSDRSCLGSLQLTPLLSKLNALVTENHSSPTWKAKVSDIPNKKTFPKEKDQNATKEIKESESSIPQSAGLFLFAQQQMALALIVDENVVKNPDTIHSLWQICMASLIRLEQRLRNCFEQYPQGEDVGSSVSSEPYSYACIEPGWDMRQRGGHWGCLELGLLGHLHQNFVQRPNITELVIRSEDSTIYAHQCGRSEVYYLQTSNTNSGLPMPSDLMGIVPLKARRRLERDHGIILL